MLSRFSIVLCLIVLSGCASGSGPFQRNSPNSGAYDGVSKVYPEATPQLALEAAKRLGAKYSRQTRFAVNTDTEFGRSLENALMSGGYQVSPYGTPIRYNVDMLQDAESPTAYVNLFVPDGDGKNGTGTSHLYALDTMMKTTPPAAGAPSPTGYSLEASPNNLLVGQAATVVFTLKRGGKPVTEGFKPYFEPHLNFPNLRNATRVLEKNGTITVRGLRPARTGQSTLRLILDRETYVEAPVTVVDKSITVSDLPAPAQSPITPSVASVLPVAVPPVSPPASTPAGSVVPAVLPLASGPAVSDTPSGPEWSIVPGLLRGQLAAWSNRAGYQLIWKAGYDFEMESQSGFRGDFVEAVKRLFARMHAHGNLLRATIYQDNRVLEVREE